MRDSTKKRAVIHRDADSKPTTAAQPRRCARRQSAVYKKPEPGSLYNIIHSKARIGLDVRPLLWTDLHSTLLSVHFSYEGLASFPAPRIHNDVPFRPPKPTDMAKRLSREVSTFADRKSPSPAKTHALRELMSGFFPSMSSAMADEELKLRFGKSSYQKAVMLSMVWNKGSLRSQSIEFAAARPVSSSPRKSKSSEANLSSAPLIAFVDREYPPRARKTLFRVPPGPLDDSYRSSPVLNLIQLRLKGLVPADTDQYAYLVAVLIPMAQQQLYGNDGRRRFKLSPPANEALSSDLSKQSCLTMNSIYDIQVRVFKFDAAENNLVIYTGTIGADFLEGFANPARTLHKKLGGASSMRIDYTRVPIWPFYGLKERLASALGSEVTGERFDGPDYDFYGEELSSNEAGLVRRQTDSEHCLAALNSQKPLQRSPDRSGNKRTWASTRTLEDLP